MNRALPPGDSGNRSSDPAWEPGCRGALPSAGRLVCGVVVNREMRQRPRFHVNKHGGFARFWRETPCALSPISRRDGMVARMFLIDKGGKGPVCASCHRLGPLSVVKSS